MIPIKLRIIREENRLYIHLLKFFSLFSKKGPEIYIFHDIIDNKEDVKSDYALSLPSFENFLHQRLKNGWKAMTYLQLSEMIVKKGKLKQPHFMVTFDDCNESVFTKAYPFLKEHNIPFILFITKKLIGKTNFITKDQLILLSKDPLCTIGSHGCEHVMYRYLTTEKVASELEESKIFLEGLIGKSVDCFAFPYGRLVECSYKNIRDLSKSNYRFAFSAVKGSINLKWLTGNYFLPRINVDEKIANRK